MKSDSGAVILSEAKDPKPFSAIDSRFAIHGFEACAIHEPGLLQMSDCSDEIVVFHVEELRVDRCGEIRSARRVKKIAIKIKM